MGVRLIADIYTLAGIHSDVRHREGQCSGNRDRPHTVIMDGETLYPRPIDFLRLMNFDVLNQLVQHSGCELFGPRVLADRRDEHIRRHSLALGAFNALLQGLDLGSEFLLLVLIHTLKQGIKLPVTGFRGIQLLLNELSLILRRLLGEAHHQCGELFFIVADKAGQPPDFGQHNLLQKVGADIVCRGTSSTVALVVGAVEILDLRVALVEMEVKVIAAVRTDQKAGKHMFLTFMSAALTDLSPPLLNFLPGGPVNDGLMHILEDCPILAVIFNAALVFVGLGVGLEIENIAAIFLERKDFGNG